MLTDIICFSNINSTNSYQRLQQLANKFFKANRIFIVDKPVVDSSFDFYHTYKHDENSNIWNIVPYIQAHSTLQLIEKQKLLLNTLINTQNIQKFVVWYSYSTNLDLLDCINASFAVLDCMNENTVNKLITNKLETEKMKWLQKADMIFTKKHSLLTLKQNNKKVFSYIQENNIQSTPAHMSNKKIKLNAYN